MSQLLPRLLACLSVAVVLAVALPARAADAPVTHFKDDGVKLATQTEMEKLAKEDAIVFLENCLRRMVREVKSYSMTMQKQELMDRKLGAREVLDVHFREKPFSVYMEWKEGTGKAERVLYVEGENSGNLLARPAGKLARLVAGDVVARDPDSEEARQSGRYSIKEFGIRVGTERTWNKWKAAQDKGKLKVEYLGIEKPKDLGGRPCWVLKRTCDPPDPDGSVEGTIYVDTETWLQVGSVMKGARNQLIGAYYFRDIRLNPDFKDKQFDKAALTP